MRTFETVWELKEYLEEWLANHKSKVFGIEIKPLISDLPRKTFNKDEISEVISRLIWKVGCLNCEVKENGKILKIYIEIDDYIEKIVVEIIPVKYPKYKRLLKPLYEEVELIQTEEEREEKERDIEINSIPTKKKQKEQKNKIRRRRRRI
jgi:hypothetical protein